MSSQPPHRPSDSELMPPPPRPPARTRATGRTATPITNPDSDSNSGTDTAVPPSTPRARTRVSKHSTEQMLDDLRASLQGYQAKANYCCGGSIPIQPEQRQEPRMSSKEPVTAPSVVLRFDKPDGSVSRVQFPLSNDNSGLEELLRACTPATFGSRGKRILDENYGETRELDPSKFSVDFHPHDYGIIDTIAQILLPGINRPIADESLNSREEHWGVRAELHKLNIYSAPSAKFQIHNTPLAALQFGTLIISLPTPHQGGQHHLTHKTHHSTIDSSTSPPSITWTAFHSTCAHEILPVIAGHCVTLTYNLFVCERVGGPLQRYPTADPRIYPLYGMVKEMLGREDFLPDGGTLAHFLTSTTPTHHTSRSFTPHLPYSLTGLDATLFSVLSSLNLRPSIHPILGDEAWDEWDEWRMQHFFDRDHDQDEDNEFQEFLASRQNIWRVGEKFSRVRMLDLVLQHSDDPTPVLTPHFPFQERSDVTWLNEARHEAWEVQLVHLKQGNEGGDGGGDGGGEGEGVRLLWHYSCAAIFVDVPAWGKGVRRGKGKGKERA